jgi:heme exporter protein D
MLALGLVSSQFACALGSEKLVKGTVKGGIEGGLEGTLEALNDPHNQELIRRLMKDRDVNGAAHNLTEAITGGALDGLTDDERQRKVRELSDAYIRTVAASVGKALNDDINPAVTKTVEDVVGGAIASALSSKNKRLASGFVDNVTRTTITAFTQSTAQGMRDDLGPAMNKVIAQDLGPALAKVIAQDVGPALTKVINEDLKPALSDALGAETNSAIAAMVREVTKQAVLGANDGMVELGVSLSPKDRQGGLGLFGWSAILLGLVTLILGILLTRTIMTRRSLERERARSERMLLNVLRSIQPNDDLDALIARARLNDNDLDPGNDTYVNSLLARARGARATPPAGPGKPRA